MKESLKAKITAMTCAFIAAIIFLFRYLCENEHFTMLSIVGMVLFFVIFVLLKCAKGKYGREGDLDKFTIPIWIAFSIMFAFLVCLCTTIPTTEKYLEVFGASFASWCFGAGLIGIVGIGMGSG